MGKKTIRGMNPTGKLRIRHRVQNLIFGFSRFRKVFFVRTDDFIGLAPEVGR
jgi:hypothetical protein